MKYGEIIPEFVKGINNNEIIHCQSCGMPLMSNEILGTETDGSINEDFCKYCYDKGDFVEEMIMEDMINFCAPKVAESHSIDINKQKTNGRIFPKLKKMEAIMI